MRNKPHTDALVATIAARQHGVISTSQLVRCGLSRAGVARRVAAGRLFPIHRGVYAVGHAGLTDHGRWKAATLAVPESVLSHRSAAELWQLLEPAGGVPQITVPHPAAPARRAQMRIFRSRTLAQARTTLRNGVPVTTPARTLTDLARVVPPKLVRRATRQAEYLGLPLEEVETDGTRSEPESAFLRLCRRHRLPLPEVNARIGPYTVDFLWRDERLVVEVDGYGAHRGRQAFLDDRDRELYLRSLGLSVQRFSDEQIARRAAAVAASVGRALARREPPSGS